MNCEAKVDVEELLDDVDIEATDTEEAARRTFVQRRPWKEVMKGDDVDMEVEVDGVDMDVEVEVVGVKVLVVEKLDEKVELCVEVELVLWTFAVRATLVQRRP